MTLDEIKHRWSGLQTTWKDGCYFFALLTIAEEVTGKRIDLVTVTRMMLDKGFLNTDGYVSNPCAMLKELTGRTFRHDICSFLPDAILSNMYTIEKWVNPKTKFTHFKRRFVDTLLNSKTIAEGHIDCYYIFTEV